MSEERKTAGAGFWITVALVMALVCVGSIGPAYRMAIRIRSRAGPDLEWPMTVVETVYAPAVRLASTTNSSESFAAYIEWWLR